MRSSASQLIQCMFEMVVSRRGFIKGSAGVVGLLCLGVDGACQTNRVPGHWISGGTLDVNGIHAALMPNGLVLVFGYNHLANFYDQEGGYQLWDPTTRTPAGQQQSITGFNPFCGGHSFLGDGRLFLAGGYKSGDPLRASSADEVRVIESSGRTVTWAGADKMQNVRWYPTCVTLASGDSFIIGGSAPFVSDNWKDTDEDYEYFNLAQNGLVRQSVTQKKLPEDGPFKYPNGDNRQHVADGSRLAGLYPLTHLLPNQPGDDAPEGVLFVLAESFVRLYNPATNTIMQTKQDAGGFRTWWTQASSVLLPIDIDAQGAGPGQVRIMIFGGGSYGKGDNKAPALDTADIWTYNVSSRLVSFEQSLKLSRPRFMGDSILLPDGTIVLLGGSSTGYTNANSDRVLAAELIVAPERGSAASVTVLADALDTQGRGYHASAVLLPDAAVLVTGGTGYWHSELTSSGPPEEHKTVDLLEPPYLAAGARPRILQAPTRLNLGDVFEVTSDASADIVPQVVLIRSSSRTHSLDTDQRLLHLAATQRPGPQASTVVLTAHMPSSGAVAPPGPYMLFVLRHDSTARPAGKVPSLASLVMVDLAKPTSQPLRMIRFVVGTGNDDLGGGLNGSSATADVILQNGSSFTVTLRDASEPSWANGSIHQVDAPVPDTVSPPLTADKGIAGVRLNLVQHNPDWSADNWDVASLQVSFYDTGIAPVCQVNLVGTHRLQDGSLGLVRLSKNADSKGSGPMSQVFSGGCS